MGSGFRGSLTMTATTRTSDFAGAPPFDGAELRQPAGRKTCDLLQDGTRVAHGKALREARELPGQQDASVVLGHTATEDHTDHVVMVVIVGPFSEPALSPAGDVFG